MRIAVLADIHGNLPALERVLADVAEQGADAIVVLGDLADRGPFPVETIGAVRAAAHVVLCGNTDERLLRYDQRDVPESWYCAAQFESTRWTYEQLSRQDLTFLGSLPEQRVLVLGGLPPVRFVHGSPRSASEPVYPDRDLRAADALRQIDEDILAVAHTHISWLARRGSKLAFNPGSVGQPFNGDPRAQYALLTGRNGGWQVEHRALDYDRAPLCAAFQASGLLDHEDGFSRAAMASMMTGRDEIWPFLRHAFRLRGEADALHEVVLDDDVWQRAGATYDWEHAERGSECTRS